MAIASWSPDDFDWWKSSIACGSLIFFLVLLFLLFEPLLLFSSESKDGHSHPG